MKTWADGNGTMWSSIQIYSKAMLLTAGGGRLFANANVEQKNLRVNVSIKRVGLIRKQFSVGFLHKGNVE